MIIRYFTLILLVFILCASCTATKNREGDQLDFASFDNFKLGPEGGVDLVWSTKRIYDAQALKEVLHKYDSLILDQTWFVVGKESVGNLDDEQILSLSRQMINEIKSRLGYGFKLVDDPTENTLRLSIALSDIEMTHPGLAVTNLLLPDDYDSSTVSKIVVDEEVKTGRVTVELLVSDARSREPLIAVIDTLFGHQELGTVMASSGGAREAISSWADRLWTTLSYWNWIRERTSR